MAEFNQNNQFGSAKPVRTGKGMTCAECEAMLMDALDGTLSPEEQAAFDLHISSCDACSRMLADAQRGAALLEMLKSPRPEPPPQLLERILAETTGVTLQISSPLLAGAIEANGAALTGTSVLAGTAALPGLTGGNVLPFRSRLIRGFSPRAIGRTLMQPRLAMTAAMAFFSIALTLNLTGVHPSELKASDLTPSNLKRTFYQADASLVRYYDNLRVVYELESRVRDLQRSNDDENRPPAKQNSKPGASDGNSGEPGQDKPGGSSAQPQRQSPKAGSGTSERRGEQEEFRLAKERTRQLRSDSEPEALSFATMEPVDGLSTTDKLKKASWEGGSV